MANGDEVKSIQEKFTDLESKYSFQENTLSELNDALVDQQRQIDAMQHELTLIKQHLAQQAETAAKSEDYPGGGIDEKPPHY
ncbi:MAG: SlyX family protein [Pseudohongiellaceae bacterium]